MEEKKNTWCKKVNRKVFEENLIDFIKCKVTSKEAAKACGLVEATFMKRLNQYLDPVNYGELPEDFFGKGDDARIRNVTMDYFIEDLRKRGQAKIWGVDAKDLPKLR